MTHWKYLGIFIFGILTMGCNRKFGSKNDLINPNQIQVTITSADQSKLLEKQVNPLVFSASNNDYFTIDVNKKETFQSIDGFGFTLTGGSATLIQQMSKIKKEALLNQLFGCADDSYCISYLRIGIGATDLDEYVFSYADNSSGKKGDGLSSFNFSKDSIDLIPLLKEIVQINPNIKIMGSPWSAPTWMKDNKSSIGGHLLPKYYGMYADYFVKYVQEMNKKGIKIDAITIQNEPEHGGNNPSMLMSEANEGDFIKNHLGPKFKAANIKTKIIIWDHNCDKPSYPITILNDTQAKPFIDGSAFHLYAGNIDVLSKVHDAHPDKNVYFTEQWTGSKGNFEGDLLWHTKNVLIGSLRNWSKTVLEWNLANDPNYEPHTPGGCTQCKGALTLDRDDVTKNVSLYVIAHASKFIPAGSTRISSTSSDDLQNVAFITPSGNTVIIVLNETTMEKTFNIQCDGKKALVTIPGKSVGTLMWS